MPAKETRVPHDSLERFVSRIFEQGGGCPPEDAKTIAQCLVQTNLWGIDGHGVIRVPIYLERFENGAMNNRPKVRRVRAEGGLEVLDADNGAGYIAGRAAMQRAIELARDKAIAAVGIINSNHCGATALYARMAAEAGLVGFAMTYVAPNLSMPGGK